MKRFVVSLRPFVHRIRTLLSAAFAELVKCSFESSRQLIRRSPPPVMKEDDRGLCVDHVLVDRNDVQPVLPEGLQGWCDFAFQHRNIASYHRILIRAVKRRPGVQAHARVDCGTHFLNGEIIPPDGDLVYRTVLLALMSNDFRDFCCIQRAPCGNASMTHRGGIRALPNQLKSWLDLIG